MCRKITFALGATIAIIFVAVAVGWAGETVRQNIQDGTQTQAISVTANPQRPLMTNQPAPNPNAIPSSPPRPRPVTVSTPGFWAWALLDRQSGTISGSINFDSPQFTASMIKVWLATDYLRLTTLNGKSPSPENLQRLSGMIRDSDNDVASDIYREIGYSASISRLIMICGLTDSRAGNDWAHTRISARDATRMGHCIADGRGAGPAWTPWLLNEMRNVRGSGRFGPVDVLPETEAQTTAIKNGWVVFDEDRDWHVNCLAVGSTWVLAIETAYPETQGVDHGAAICRSVTQQLLGPHS